HGQLKRHAAGEVGAVLPRPAGRGRGAVRPVVQQRGRRSAARLARPAVERHSNTMTASSGTVTRQRPASTSRVIVGQGNVVAGRLCLTLLCNAVLVSSLASQSGAGAWARDETRTP